jgi:hypothetical protein
MTFLLPGLLGLGAALLALPVLIHLWSRRPATLVRVGSVKLLAGARPSQARRPALTDIPLLLLRLAIVAAAGLAAAGLARPAGAVGQTRLALVAPLGATTERLADSLAAAGWQVHWLDVGLPAITAPTVSAARDAAAPIAAVATWSLLRDAARRFASVDSVLVLAPRTVAALDGAPTALPFAVRWEHLAVDDRTTTPVRARLHVRDATPRDSARLFAALAVVTASAGRTFERAGDDEPADVTLRIVPDLTGIPDADDPAAPLRHDAALGAWLVPAAALAEASIAEPLAYALRLRRDEPSTIVLPAAAVAPGGVAQADAHEWRSLHAWLGALALVLFAVERLVAAGRLRTGDAA